MKFSEERIKAISDELQSGLACYIHRKTFNVISIPNPLSGDAGYEGWEEQEAELEKNGEQYLEIFPMDSRTSFRVMEDFMEQMDDLRFKVKMMDALEGKKPFRRFKNLIDDSHYREKWFEHRDERYLKYVERSLWFGDEEE